MRLILVINFFLASKVFVHLLGKVPPSRGLTHMRSMCVGVAETGVEHCSPAKNHKVTFIFSYFCVTKRMVQGGEATSERRRRDGVYQKSFKRAFLPLKKHLPRARVSRASHAWQVRATKDKVKIGSFATLHSFIYTTRANISHEKAEQIRARTLSARPLKVQGGRGWSKYADETIKIILILLCSHTDAHPNLNREVRHSLTWHSSKSESAFERFELAAVVKL